MSHQRLNVEPSFNFHQWLVGFTDGDGCFSITQQKSNLQFTFKITQSVYNYRVLYYIKKNIGYGSITQDGNSLVQYRIRDTKILKQIILPIFDLYPLHTSKHVVYVLWKQALLFPSSKRQTDLLSTSQLCCLLDNQVQVKDSYPKSWIVGFVETHGSFFLTGNNRIVHAFCITQKDDCALLQQLKRMFHIKAKIKNNKKQKHIF